MCFVESCGIAVENLLSSGKRRCIFIRHAEVFAKVKAEAVVAFHPGGTAQSFETVHNQDAFAPGSASAQCERFRRETLAALVDGRHFIAILQTFADGQQYACVPVNNQSVVEILVADFRVDHVARRRSFLAERVGRCPPTQQGLAFRRESGRKMMNRQRLHLIVLDAVFIADKLQDGFINRSRQGKFEERVVPEFHVGEILVREHFENGRRHVRRSRLPIVAVPEFASCPRNVEEAREVVGHVCHRHTDKIRGCLSREPRWVRGVLFVVDGGADTQCAIDGIIVAYASVTVNSQRQFERHPFPRFSRHVDTAAAQIIEQERARTDVVVVVVLSAVLII